MSDTTARNRRDPASAHIAPFQIRGRFLTALALRIDAEDDIDALYEHLDVQLKQTPQFYDEAPMVLDLSNAPGTSETGRLRVLVANMRRRNLRVFGVQSGGTVSQDALQELGLIEVSPGRDAPSPEDRRAKRRSRLSEPEAENKVIKGQVRSGQMVVAEHGDLTIIGSVASGAELVAKGSIHIYGRMRGRAMAGMHGDETARIFCQKLDAELIAIAGLYQTSETLATVSKDGCAHIYLEDEQLRVEVI